MRFFASTAIALVFAPLCLFAEDATPALKAAPSPAAADADRLGALDAEQVKQALSVLQQRHVASKSLDPTGLERATLRGLFDELSPGAELVGTETSPATPSPFRAETLQGGVGYIRLGALEPATVTEVERTLKDFAANKVDAVVLDLRATPESADYALAAAVAARFVAKGVPLFSLSDAEGRAAKTFASEGPQVFSGAVVIVADESAAGAAEALAAALRRNVRALLVGTATSGRAVEFSVVPLGKGQNLRLAVAEVRVDGLPAIYPRGLRPDLEVAQPAEVRENVLADGLEKGASPFVFERERAQMNEAALVAGTNPEIDAEEPAEGLVDRPLQRAVDLVTALRIFRDKN